MKLDLSNPPNLIFKLPWYIMQESFWQDKIWIFFVSLVLLILFYKTFFSDKACKTQWNLSQKVFILKFVIRLASIYFLVIIFEMIKSTLEKFSHTHHLFFDPFTLTYKSFKLRGTEYIIFQEDDPEWPWMTLDDLEGP